MKIHTVIHQPIKMHQYYLIYITHDYHMPISLILKSLCTNEMHYQILTSFFLLLSMSLLVLIKNCNLNANNLNFFYVSINSTYYILNELSINHIPPNLSLLIKRTLLLRMLSINFFYFNTLVFFCEDYSKPNISIIFNMKL